MRLALLVCAGVLLLAATGAAEKLYTYRNEQGTLTFSDRPPAGGGQATVRQAVAADLQARFTVRRTGTDELPTLVAVNEYHGPVEVEVTLEAENVQSSRPLPVRLVVPALREVAIASLQPQDAHRRWSYRYGWQFVPGDPAAVHQPPVPYSLPFAADASFRVTQAFFGTATHNNPQNQYAVDIAMPPGTAVLAAREGIVMEVAQDFFGSGTDDPRYLGRANFVRVVHDDGTMAIYAHLALETSEVYPGMRVAAGQVLARSGNTGFSTGPHLHFVIQKNAGMRLVSVPFTFADPVRGAVVPAAGMSLGGGMQNRPDARESGPTLAAGTGDH